MTQNKTVQSDIGRHQEKRKELERNQKRKYYGKKEEIGEVCPLTRIKQI
jgi:hypothetical protein